jgi:mono/diheme cytochrome c family protein
MESRMGRRFGKFDRLGTWSRFAVLAGFAVTGGLAFGAVTSTARLIAAGPVTQAPSSRSVWQGVYTEEQSKRGQTAYEKSCASCHSASLAGGDMAPGLVGPEFSAEWNGQTVGDVFERIRASMPQEDPGSLTREQYADIVAYILSMNKFPAGAKELEHDAEALKQVKWEPKTPGVIQ